MKRSTHRFSDARHHPPAQRQAIVDTYFESEAQYWKHLYKRRDTTATTFQHRTERSLQWVKELRLHRGSDILDAGCGAGVTSVALAQSGYRVHAVDHVPAMLDLARESAEQAGVQDLVKLSLADICSLNQFSDNSFGLVLCLGVIGWLQSPEQAIREMHRVMRPGGYLILSVGNRWCLQDVLNPPYNPLLEPLRLKLVPWFRRVGLLAPAVGAPRPLTRRRNAEIDRMLWTVGLQKIKSSTVGFGPFTFFKMSLFPDSISVRLHETLQSWADRDWPLLRSAGAMYVVLSRKPN